MPRVSCCSWGCIYPEVEVIVTMSQCWSGLGGYHCGQHQVANKLSATKATLFVYFKAKYLSVNSILTMKTFSLITVDVTMVSPKCFSWELSSSPSGFCGFYSDTSPKPFKCRQLLHTHTAVILFYIICELATWCSYRNSIVFQDPQINLEIHY